MTEKFLFWIPFVFVITALSGMVYLVGQQNFRMNADDPQIAMSEDIAKQLSDGVDVQTIIPHNAVDISAGLSPFIIIYNKEDPIASNALLNGKTPQLPPGVLSATALLSQDRLTWQPRPGIRIAAIITPFANKQLTGYVLVGRSLREVEKRIDQLTAQVVLGWSVMMVGSLLTVFLFLPGQKKK